MTIHCSECTLHDFLPLLDQSDSEKSESPDSSCKLMTSSLSSSPLLSTMYVFLLAAARDGLAGAGAASCKKSVLSLLKLVVKPIPCSQREIF
jgi:hypothetical protein